MILGGVDTKDESIPIIQTIDHSNNDGNHPIPSLTVHSSLQSTRFHVRIDGLY